MIFLLHLPLYLHCIGLIGQNNMIRNKHYCTSLTEVKKVNYSHCYHAHLCCHCQGIFIRSLSQQMLPMQMNFYVEEFVLFFRPSLQHSVLLWIWSYCNFYQQFTVSFSWTRSVVVAQLVEQLSNDITFKDPSEK